MYAGRNYGNVNVSKVAGGYWKEEEDIREYWTLYSPLSNYREWENESNLCWYGLLYIIHGCSHVCNFISQDKNYTALTELSAVTAAFVSMM